MENNRLSNGIRSAIDSYMDGCATEEQERMLRGFLDDNEEIPAELKAVKTMLSGFSEMSGVSFDTEAFADRCLKSARKGLPVLRLAGALAIAASVAVAAVLSVPKKQSVYGYDIYGQAIVNVDDALDNLGPISLVSQLGESMAQAEYLINQLVEE